MVDNQPLETIQEQPFEFNEVNVQRLKEKYSREIEDDAKNPVKIGLKLVFQAAIERDSEKRTQLAFQLSQFLIKPDGIVNLFLALIDFDASSQRVTTHNQRFMAVANIITCLPKLCLPYEQYCQNISFQLKSPLVCDNAKYSTLAGIIMKAMLESPHAKDKDISQIIFGPICKCIIKNSPHLTLNDAIKAVHNLLQIHVPPKLFVQIFPNLFFALCALYETPSHLRKYIKTSLVTMLNDLKPGIAVCLLEETLFFNNDACRSYSAIAADDQIQLSFNEVLATPGKESVLIDLCMDILKTCDNQMLTLEFFFHFQAKMWASKDEDSRQRCASLIEPLLQQSIEEQSGHLDLLSSIANNCSRALELVTRTLLNYLESLRSYREVDDDSWSGKSFESSFGSCINIIEVISSTIADNSQRDLLYHQILPVLKDIDKQFNSNPPLTKKTIKSLKSIIVRLESFRSPDDLELDGKISEAEKEYKTLINDLNDKLVPVRVHSLVRMKQMLLNNDKFMLSKVTSLYPMIESCLADGEPYVYLSCINLIAELAIRNTEGILPRLIEVYSTDAVGVQQRINVGEVLVRLAKQMNKTAPFYAQQVMTALLINTEDSEELVRMSSLVNIGQISNQLGFSSGRYILDILRCVERVISGDTIPTQCAAIDLLRHLLMGLDKITVESIQLELKSIYSLLKKLQLRVLDEKLCVQVGLALDELGELAKSLLGFGEADES